MRSWTRRLTQRSESSASSLEVIGTFQRTSTIVDASSPRAGGAATKRIAGPRTMDEIQGHVRASPKREVLQQTSSASRRCLTVDLCHPNRLLSVRVLADRHPELA